MKIFSHTFTNTLLLALINIVHKLEKIRELKRVPKTVLADKIGITRETIYNWTDETIKLSSFLKACKILDTDPVSFFSHEEGGKVLEPKPPYGKKDECADLRAMNLFLMNQVKAQTETINKLSDKLKK